MSKRILLSVLVITIIFSGITISSIFAEQNSQIPEWVRNNALWWGQGQISDSDFISAITYLIDNNVLRISQPQIVDEKYFGEYKEWATDEIGKYKEYSEQLKTHIDVLDAENRKLRNDLQYEKQSSLDDLLEKFTLKSELERYKDYSKEVEEYAKELQEYAEIESSKPQTIIDDQKINWHVTDSTGNKYHWSMPIETYENLIRSTEPLDTLRLENTNTGDIFTVRDHTKFVRNGFSNVIDEIYDNLENKSLFPYEVWFIVSQLTTYSYDIGEDPRWALETLSRGGGDCEDTAILIAEMLKSSIHTTNWKIQLVYFDADNPRNPQTMNHVAVHIDDGTYSYILESTAKNDPYSWEDGIIGWYFDA